MSLRNQTNPSQGASFNHLLLSMNTGKTAYVPNEGMYQAIYAHQSARLGDHMAQAGHCFCPQV